MIKTKKFLQNMGLRIISRAFLFCCAFSTFCIPTHSESSLSGEVSVRFLEVPPSFSNNKSATFLFEALEGGTREMNCSNCTFTCKLNEGMSSNCEDRNATFLGLQDGHYTFMVCAKASQGVGCSSYNWTVDTVSPTAYITAMDSLTNAVNVSVNISFSEPCSFGCLTTNTCNLIVYGDGRVIPQTLSILEPKIKYSMIIALSSSTMYGRAILVMDKGFCTDAAGNRFTRTENSTFTIRFDRRSAVVYLRTHVPEKLVELNGQTRSVQATNDDKKLKVYLYFSQPILNTSDEILTSLNVSHGLLQPIQGKSQANRRFGYLLKDIPNVALVTINFIPDMIISKEGNWVSPISPATLLYDSKRPGVVLSTDSMMRTKEKTIAVSVRFTKPVFGFNSTQISISGGHIQSFHQVSRNYYAANIEATDEMIYMKILENVTSDVAGNKNLPSNVLQVRHYSMPVASAVLGYFVTASFLATCLLAGLLTVSTASLQSASAVPRSRPSLTSDPTRNLFRIACYIQVFALSRWLVATLPIEYFELTACLKWSVPYFNLPWESEHGHVAMLGGTPSSSSKLLATSSHRNPLIPTTTKTQSTNVSKASVVYAAPFTTEEYRSFFESQNYVPQAEYVPDPQNVDGWMDFKRSMFWLAVISGGLILLHIMLLLILKLREHPGEKKCYGALVFPRFEIFLAMLSVPCICKAAVSIIKGGTQLGIIVGVCLLVLASSLQLGLLVFLSMGITLGKVLQYKEVHQVGQKFHWYQELIRVTLGPGKRGQWTWKDQPNSAKLTKLGPLFEDLRGPPKYMLSQFSTTGSSSSALRQADRIIASDDETEDAEAPLIQKVFGILRIYYTFVESLKRFMLGVASGLVFFSGTVHPSKAPTITLLTISSFQLFFVILKKPFIKKKVQLVEIISLACQVAMFATITGLLERDYSSDNKVIGIVMLALFAIGYLALLVNEWYALWKQIKRLDTQQNGFRAGLRRCSAGLLLFCFPEKLINRLLETNGNPQPQHNGNGTPLALPPYRSSGSRGSSGADRPNDSTVGNSRWSRFWSRKTSGSTSKASSTDYKSNSKSKSGGLFLYKDMEAIFAASSSSQSGPAGERF